MLRLRRILVLFIIIALVVPWPLLTQAQHLPKSDRDQDGFGYWNDCDDRNAEYNPNVTWYLDVDGDGYYAETSRCQPGETGMAYDWHTDSNLGLDCDDQRSYIHPGAKEICADDIDQNCDFLDLYAFECDCPDKVTEENIDTFVKIVREEMKMLDRDLKVMEKDGYLCDMKDLIPQIYSVISQNPEASELVDAKKTTTTSTYYYHNDHLSGTTVVTDEDGNLVEAKDYYPYGETRVEQEGTSGHKPDYGFTGKEEDKESGLHYFGARFYKALIGRFTQPDPVALYNPEKHLDDPQQLNMYSYARNNPITFNDPTGLETSVYIEKSNSADGYKATFGHSFIEISRDGENTIYSWALDDGNYGTKDLTIMPKDDFLARENKNSDQYTIYTFDTSEEQEGRIVSFYSELAEKNRREKLGHERLSFSHHNYNCTNVVVDALKTGDIASDNFYKSILSNPGGLRNRLDAQYETQQPWYKKILSMGPIKIIKNYLRSLDIKMNVEKEIIQTGENQTPQRQNDEEN